MRKQSENWCSGYWFPLHDSAAAHSAFSVQEFLDKNGTIVVARSPYSHDLATCDFFLFPEFELVLKGRIFGDTPISLHGMVIS
jgi:hypothetical protein